MRWKRGLVAALGWLAIGGNAHPADIFLGTSKQSFEKISIGLLPFVVPGVATPFPNAHESPADMAIIAESILKEDLLRSQLFKVPDFALGEAEGMDIAQGISRRIKTSAQNAGILAIASAKLYTSSGRWVMEAYTYETHQGNPVIRVKITADTVRPLAHRFADKLVYHFTGEQGIAQTQIAYQSERDGKQGIYRMDYDGKNERKTISHKTLLFPPRWSFDAAQIGYALYDRGHSDLYLLNLATGLRNKIFSSRRLSFSPVWQPSGAWVAFASTKDGNADIYMMRSSGAGLKQLTFHSAADLAPAWSQTGREIAFTSDRGGSPQIYIMDVDGGPVRRLTYVGDYNTSAAWSPRGDWIAYACRNRHGFMKLCANSVSGQRRVEITVDGAWDDESPSWAPNGREIVFTSSRFGRKQIFAIRPDQTGLMRLTANEWENSGPVWSPR